MDKIAIILPVHNRKSSTLNCLAQLHRISTAGFEAEIVAVDDGSTDGTSEAISKLYPDVTILKGDGNLWWAGGVNMGFEYALENKFDHVYTLNDDIDFLPDTLQVLYETAKKNKNAVCGSMFMSFWNRDKIVYTGVKLHGFFRKLVTPIKGEYNSSYVGKIIEADTLSTKSTLTPVEIIKDVGLMDSKHFPHNFADFDYFMQIKSQGYSLLVNMDSRIYTRGSDTNFHHLILNKSRKEVFKTFFDIKYGNEIRTVYRIATRRVGLLKGHILFVRYMLPFCFWFALKIFLPKSILKKILDMTGRNKFQFGK